MFTLAALATTYGMSRKQVRDRVTVLEPLINPHIVDGKNNAILLKDSGRAILDRLIQLEQDGLTISSAKVALEKELAGNGIFAAGATSSNGQHLEGALQQMQARLDEQGQQIGFLQHQIKRLADQLGELHQRVLPMLPDSVENGRKPWWHFWR